MVTIVPPATIKQVAQFITSLERRGVGAKEIQRAIEDASLLSRLAAILRDEEGDSFIDLNTVEFDIGAMSEQLKRVLGERWHRYQWNEKLRGYYPDGTWSEGYALEDLATTVVFRDLLTGLSNIHVAVVVWRAGLLGEVLSTNEVAERLGISGDSVSQLRSEATRHMQARARTYVLRKWNQWTTPSTKLDQA